MREKRFDKNSKQIFKEDEDDEFDDEELEGIDLLEED